MANQGIGVRMYLFDFINTNISNYTLYVNLYVNKHFIEGFCLVSFYFLQAVFIAYFLSQKKAVKRVYVDICVLRVVIVVIVGIIRYTPW